MKSDFLLAVGQLAAERHLSREVVLHAVETALISAYKKDSRVGQHNITVRIQPTTGEVHVYAIKRVAQEPIEDPRLEITLAEARTIDPSLRPGDELQIDITTHTTERIAAQTARQVVLQKLREAERDLVYEEFVGKEGEVVSGIIQRTEPSKPVVLDLGRAEAILPPTEQVPGEKYRLGQRLRAYVIEVTRNAKGPQVVASRTHRTFLRRLFELEVPEIHQGLVEIKAISREPGQRSKVAVSSRQEGLDPVGACIGLRGIRVQNVVNELGGEKVDLIEWSPDPAVFVAHALSPAQVLSVHCDPAENTASVVVPDRHLSLAIGKQGQNARLAARLTGWRIDIKSASAATLEPVAPAEVLESKGEDGARPTAAEEGALATVPEMEEAVATPVAEVEISVEISEVAARPEEELAPVESAVPWLEVIEREPVTVAAEPPPAAEGSPTAPRIRFAEEVFQRRGRGRPAQEASSRRNQPGQPGQEAAGRAPRKRRSRPLYPDDDDIEQNRD